VAIRSRLNAALLDHGEQLLHRTYGARKRQLFADLPDRVVEIGPGPGANLRYFRPGTRLVAFEPGREHHPRLRRNAARRGIELELHPEGAERTHLPPASCDVVVATLVLCSVTDPARVIAEVHRILRPGGRLLFCEHVAAPPGSWTRRLQGWLRRPWRWLADGCTLDRETHRLLQAAGFQDVQMDCFTMGRLLGPVRPHVWGTAVR
jgi:SAM-dependent methyltransferase